MGNLCVNAKNVEEKKVSESARESDKTPQQKKYPYNWPVGAEQVGYLTERQVKARLKTQTEQVVDLPDGYRFRWAAASQRGYYPSQADKANQDSFAARLRRPAVPPPLRTRRPTARAPAPRCTST